MLFVIEIMSLEIVASEFQDEARVTLRMTLNRLFCTLIFHVLHCYYPLFCRVLSYRPTFSFLTGPLLSLPFSLVSIVSAYPFSYWLFPQLFSILWPSMFQVFNNFRSCHPLYSVYLTVLRLLLFYPPVCRESRLSDWILYLGRMKGHFTFCYRVYFSLVCAYVLMSYMHMHAHVCSSMSYVYIAKYSISANTLYTESQRFTPQICILRSGYYPHILINWEPRFFK